MAETIGMGKIGSPQFLINLRKRKYWSYRYDIISCRIRNKSNNKAKHFSANIRAWLLEDPEFMKIYRKTDLKISNEDAYIMHHKPDGIIDIKDYFKILSLEKIASCRLIAYEKEFFYLKNYLFEGIKPHFTLRVCYHSEWEAHKIYFEAIPFELLLSCLKFDSSIVNKFRELLKKGKF